MTKFPTLYKRTSTGAIEQWRIWVDGCIIMSEHGQVGGKLQMAVDEVKLGKRGTTPETQALAEATAKHTKQLKKGYVDSIEKAEAGETDDVIEGGILPMLAHKHKDQGHKIKYPAYVQPKLDGTRCIAILKNGKCTLWSRTRKPINSMPHIVKAIEDNFKKDIVLDGEIYADSFSKDFEGLISLVRPDEAVEGHEAMQYHIYDIVSDKPYGTRHQYLKQLHDKGPLVFVQTERVKDEEEMLEQFGQFVEEGYEGLMIRNADGKYKNSRSYDLQKVKSMFDDDFPIIDVKEGRGKMAGKAIFICRLPNGGTVDAKMKGKLGDLAKYMTDESLWKGKMLTIQYQGFTKDGSLRFPVGKCIRDYE